QSPRHVRAAVPAAHRAAHRRRAHKVQPYVPTGTGMWIYQWHHTSGGRPTAIVRRARWAGLSTLYVRTGSTYDGFTGAGHVRALLRAARHTSVHVVAWDFPELRHPAHDALRLAHAAHVRTASGTHV